MESREVVLDREEFEAFFELVKSALKVLERHKRLERAKGSRAAARA